MSDCKLNRLDLVLAVEVDLGESGPSLALPKPLERADADRLGVRLAADLGGLLPGIQRCGLALVGALYDQTQVLSPGFALFEGLEALYREGLADGVFQSRTVSIGASDGGLGNGVFQQRGGGGALLLVPLTVLSPSAEELQQLGTLAETTFIERGQVSPATAMALQQAFGVAIPHARFMTINDLCAMLRLQLEHIGLTELWDLLDAALFTPEQSKWALTDAGNALVYDQGHVEVLFQTFDQWARHGAGAALGGEDRYDLGSGYAAYLRVQRQFLLSMLAHDLSVRVYLATGPLPEDFPAWQRIRDTLAPIEQAHLRELTLPGDEQGPMRVTVHASDDMGTMAFTVEWVDRDAEVVRREHLYPLRPEGLRAIQSELEQRADGALDFAWPGRICYDPESRQLTGDPELAAAPPIWH